MTRAYYTCANTSPASSTATKEHTKKRLCF